jgi:hypothetical protein
MGVWPIGLHELVREGSWKSATIRPDCHSVSHSGALPACHFLPVVLTFKRQDDRALHALRLRLCVGTRDPSTSSVRRLEDEHPVATVVNRMDVSRVLATDREYRHVYLKLVDDMNTQVILIIVGSVLMVVGIVGAGKYVNVEIPSLRVWARVFLFVIGVIIFTLAFILPLNNTKSSITHSIAASTSPPQLTGSPAASPTSQVPISPTPSPTISSMTLTCSLSQKQLRPGMTIMLTYHVNSPVTRQVGLGAGLYDEPGNDHSNGDGDVSDTTLQQGLSSQSRPVTIPANLPAGKYELDAEIWPANEIGQNNVNTLTDAPCAYFSVP